MKQVHLKYVLVAVLVAFAGLAAAGMPVISPEYLAGLGAGAMLVGDTSLLEVKTLIEKQGEAWAEYKRTNDELMKAKADGKAVADLETKLQAISDSMDKLTDDRKSLEGLIAEMTSPKGRSEKDEELELEVKTFNLHMRADFQSKGKPIPQGFDVKTYTEYKSAFLKMAVGVPLEHMNESERKAMQAGSDPDGGYLLPASTVGRVVAKLYEQCSMRRLADVQAISTLKIGGLVDNDEASAGWVSELGTRSDSGTPTLGKWEIEAFELYAMPKASQTILDDAATDVEGWLARKIADKFARVEGTAFMTGTGVGQPRGIFNYTTVATADDTRAWGQFEHVVTGASADFHTTKADPLQDLIGAFKDQYLQNAQWLMRREVRTKIRKLKEATSDRYLWEPSLQAGQPDRLLGYPAVVDQYIPALAASSLSMALGDWRETYTIVDRIGVRTLRDPFTAKPYVVFYTTKRTGGGAVNYESAKFLKFSA